jgi:hypothetical protein
VRVGPSVGEMTQRGREVSLRNLQYFSEELIIPSGTLSLSFEAVDGRMMLQQADRDSPQPREIVRQSTLADATGIFVESHIQLPMAVVFNRPVHPYCTCKVDACQVVAQNVITDLFSDLIVLLSNTQQFPDGLLPRGVWGSERGEEGFTRTMGLVRLALS